MKNVIGFILMLFLMSCKSDKIMDVQGHRGCRGLMPENSIPAFEKAVKLGANTLELDVVVSKDSVVVVSHEPYISHLYCLDTEEGKDIPKSDEKSYNLYQMTFDSIKQFDCGSKYYNRFPDQKKIKTYKPSLNEVIKSAKALNPDIKFNIELKSNPQYYGVFTPKPDRFVKLVLDVVNKNDAFNQSNLQSFDLQVLEAAKEQAPNIKLAVLVDGNESIDKKLSKLPFKPDIISPYFGLLTKESVKKYQDQDYKVIPWTVNKQNDLKKMISFHVDGIITDFPDRLMGLLK